MRVYRRKRRFRLFIRRTVICIVLAGILYIIGLGAAASIGKIGSLFPKNGAGASGGGSPPSSTESSGQKKPAESASAGSSALLSSAQNETKTNGYFNDAVLIGDSRTEGLRNYDGLEGATYYAVKGLMVDTAFTRRAIPVGGQRLTVVQALQKKKFAKVYVMLGVNELGWSSGTFIKTYGKLIDAIKKAQPKAVVYIQSILPVSERKSSSSKVYNNPNIDSYNRQIKEMAKKKGVEYLAVDTAVSDSSGNLPADASSDGVHLNREYCKKWCGYLITSAGERK